MNVYKNPTCFSRWSVSIAERTREDSDVRMIPYAIKTFVEEVDNEEICREG